MKKIFDLFARGDVFVEKWLTAFCWWTDVHFNKNNVWWAKMSLLYFGPLYKGLEVYLFPLQKNSSYESAVLAILTLLFFSVMSLTVLFVSKILFILATKTPNPNREVLKFSKVICLISSGIFFCFYREISILMFLLLTYFFLCTEPIPPEEKEKRRQKILESQPSLVSV